MWWILRKRKYPSRYPSRFGVIPHNILTTHYQILHIIVETLAIVQMRLTWIWTGCIRNYIATYLALRRDASVITSGRTRCYVGTQFREQHWRLYGKNSIKNNRHWTEKTPFCSMPPAFCLKNTAKNHQKHLSIAIFMAIYGRLWQLKSYCNIGIN